MYEKLFEINSIVWNYNLFLNLCLFDSLILRALGQIMLYVDGMTGVMESPRAIQFLYKLISASNPLVCKTGMGHPN